MMVVVSNPTSGNFFNYYITSQIIDMLINSLEKFLSQWIYQTITLYTLNILQYYCQLYLNKVEKKFF